MKIQPIFKGDVLVCEDNELNRRIIQKQLANVGINAVIAPDGDKGVMLAAKRLESDNPFDLIFMDIHMPGMNGAQALERLRVLGCEAPVIAMTSDSRPDAGAEYINSGFSGYMGKPFNARELCACLGGFLPCAQSGESSPVQRSDVPVLDRRLGIDLSAGDESLYAQFLADFYADGPSTFENIGKAVYDGDYMLAHRLTHTFKGFSALIGAVRLKETAEELEQALKPALSGGSALLPSSQLQALRNCLDEVIAELHADGMNDRDLPEKETPRLSLEEINEIAGETGEMFEFSVLIADDDKSNLDMLYRVLSPIYSLYAANSGTQALRIARAVRPDLIILDVVMPDMSGFEVLTELFKDDATRNIPIIFITGLDSTEDEERGLFLGAVDYITKPFRAPIIKARVVTQLRIVKQMRTLERFGLIDALTELPNRRSFDNQLELEWGRAVRDKTELCALMLDVDRFKLYNDTYGHQQGDAVLQTLAKVFKNILKRKTDLVFRWGGEEFVVLLPETGLDGGLTVAESLRAAAQSARIRYDGGILPSVTVSVGVAAARPGPDEAASGLIEASDKALYAAKNAGRNKVCPFV